MTDSSNILICIGAQKSATTWLYKCLSEHNQVAVSEPKETNYFNVLHQWRPLEEYLSMINYNEQKVSLEASVLYLSDKDTPERIHNAVPQAKILVILRDPVERSFSHYLHLKARKNKYPNSNNLKEAVRNYPEIIGNSLYGEALERYIKIFPKEQMLVLLHSEIKASPQAVLDKICHFANLTKFTPNILNTHYHTSKARGNHLYFVIGSMYLKYRNNFIFKKIITLLKFFGINSVSIEKILARFSKTETLDQENRDFLKQFFYEDSKKLLSLNFPINPDWDTV